MSAFCMACAASLRAQAASAAKTAGKSAEAAAVAEGRRLVAGRRSGAEAKLLALIAGEKDASTRARLTSLLGLLPAAQVAPADLDAALADPSPIVRLQAVNVLGGLSGPKADSRLVKALSDVNAGVRANAAFWLGQPSHAGSEAALGRALAGDKNPDVRYAAGEALKHLGTRAANRERRRAAKDPDARVRRWAK